MQTIKQLYSILESAKNQKRMHTVSGWMLLLWPLYPLCFV